MTLDHHHLSPTQTQCHQYLSCSCPDFNQTLKVVLWDQQQQQQHQQHLIYYWPDFHQTLKKGFWNQQHKTRLISIESHPKKIVVVVVIGVVDGCGSCNRWDVVDVVDVVVVVVVIVIVIVVVIIVVLVVVVAVDLRNPHLKFGWNWVRDSWDIADIEFVWVVVGGGGGLKSSAT